MRRLPEVLHESKTLVSKVIPTLRKLLYHLRATGEDARAPEDAFEDVNDAHDFRIESETEAAPTEEVDTAPISSRARTATLDANGNQANNNNNNIALVPN
ncbi:hypothetical protein Syun_006872 [Stephania yunnanensis]|uniref:Uncharacterized protein n=1 Tax=Stephania yunnanensis TaxID=152371 RepID=A0AAP0KXP7_9MAGN